MNFDKLMDYQNMMRKNLRIEQEIDRKIDLLTIINYLTMGPKNLVQKEQIIIEANSRGFTDDEVDKLLKELLDENIIFEPNPGFIKKR